MTDQKQLDQIISILKEGFNGSSDYMSGVNDGMYYLYYYFFDPQHIPSEIIQKIKALPQRSKSLDFLAQQAQDLNMGYEK